VELRHLRYFQALAEELHFGRAAERVHVVQPHLSRQIAALEEELGVQLFARTTRGVTLTPAGEVLRQQVDGILPSIDDAVELTRIASSGAAGSLEIGYIAAAMWNVLPPVLREHRRRFPDVLFHLHELPVAGEEVGGLLDGTLDVAFIRPVARFRALELRTVSREPFVAVLPEDHPRAGQEVVDLADLAGDRFILMSRKRNPDAYDLFQEACAAAGFSPTILDQGDTPNVLYLVGIGLGVALAPAAIRRCVIPGVVFRPLSGPLPEIEMVAAYRKGDRSTSLKDFLETVASVAPGARRGHESVTA
jgi:DNA-binding transcriptional LysR family regulator